MTQKKQKSKMAENKQSHLTRPQKAQNDPQKPKKNQKTKNLTKRKLSAIRKVSNYSPDELRLIPLKFTSTSINLNSIWL